MSRDVMAELRAAHLTAPVFSDHPEFRPFCDPEALLRLGIFNGRYFDDSPDDLGDLWANPDNLFTNAASFSRQEWIDRGWITVEDPLGWVQWYLRFWRGRRIPQLDRWQIKRWNNFRTRHSGMLRHTGRGEPTRALKHRQAHLHWACWPFPDMGQPEDILWLPSNTQHGFATPAERPTAAEPSTPMPRGTQTFATSAGRASW